jgi:hypothetical protein
MHTTFWPEHLKEGDHSEDLGVDGKKILEWKWDLRRYGGNLCFGFIWIRIGKVASSCEHGNEPSDSIKCGEFLD